MIKYGRGKNPNSHKHTGGQFTRERMLGNKHCVGIKQRPETIEKRRLKLLGRVVSVETMDKLRRSHLGVKLSDEHRKKLSESHKGHVHSHETRKKMSDAGKGKKLSEENRKKWSEVRRGEKSHFWKGGLTKKNSTIRGSLEYRLWREAVFSRDNWTCVWCGQRGGTLNADHIKSFSQFPELRFAIDNGRTLCVPCHKTTDTYAIRTKSL